ncbi:MAG: hypothetical protein ABI759_14090 [Candidatus Solibacter sp.]
MRILVLLLTTAVGAAAQANEPPKAVKAVFEYLTMAGSSTAKDFKPQSQAERNRIYLRSLINPVWYLKGAFSAAIDQWNDKPQEWEQGASGYGKRFGNIMGQYAVQRTVTFGAESLLHEDNRYFGSGKKGFWRRTGYALSSSILARHDDGKRYPSVSLISGFAAGAFVSRAWLPPSQNSPGDAAVSFGFTMGYNALSCAVKEFLPDIVRPITKRHK